MATILIVDDHILNRQFLSALLGYGSHALLTAADGIEGLQLARQRHPDLIITDIMMPHMDGYEFIQRLRAEPQSRAVPVIFYTSTYSTREARTIARHCEVHWVLQKPATPESIMVAVHEALQLPAPAGLPPAASSATPRLGPLDHQLAASLELAEQSKQQVADIAAGESGEIGARLVQTAQHLSQSLADLQQVGLRLTALIDMGHEMTLLRKPTQLLAHACKVVRSLGVARFAAIGIVDDSGKALRYFVCRGLDPEAQQQLASMAPNSGILGQLLLQRVPRRLKNLDGSAAAAGLPDGHPPLYSFLGLPLATATRCYGWLYLADKLGADEFSEIDEQAAATVATQLAVCYENLQLVSTIEEQVRELKDDLLERQRISDILRYEQQRVRRLSQLYAVLSGINSAIVRIREPVTLLQEACRVAVSQGAFSMAWAGLVDQTTLEGKVVAWHGGPDGYVEQIRFSAAADGPGAERPASVALREQRRVICDDIAGEPSLAPLREDLLARGHRALAALPLYVDQQHSAVLALFADEVDFFAQEGRLALLDELAGDLTFGLAAIAKEERLHYLAYYDALTGLPNATLFQDRLGQMLHASAPDTQAAVIVINLDRFAQLNDAYGRHTGDAVLQQVARLLESGMPEPFSSARLGGDNFAVALGALAGGAVAAERLEQQVLQTLDRTLHVGAQEVRITARAGIALYPGDGSDAETLLKHAEVALKQAKAGGERSMFYAPQMNLASHARMTMEAALRTALAQGQLAMHYQPRVDLLSGRIVSAEALIRWHDPQRGMVSPAEFIPLAEQTGLIVQIGDWVIDTVYAQQAAWQAAGVRTVPVAVNLSAVQFKRGKVQHTIREAMARHGLAPHDIEFELTESVVMDDPEQAARDLRDLKGLGVKLSLDDFGTGYSSLAYLKRFPFDFVKIDRAFITDVTNSVEDAAIATAVIAMAHSLGLRVVAEGVENEGQLQFLRRHRCDELQGYYFSPPVPADTYAALLREDRRLALAPEMAQQEDTLLIVDDEPNNLSALNRLLRKEGYRVLSAGSGAEALELLAVNPVQVILSDQNMPGMSGAQFLALAKELYPDTVRMILSGLTDFTTVSDSVNQGAVFKFLTKPWDDDELRNHLRLAFRMQRRGGEG